MSEQRITPDPTGGNSPSRTSDSEGQPVNNTDGDLISEQFPTRLLPPSMACANGLHSKCDGRSPVDPDPIAECTCACHYAGQS